MTRIFSLIIVFLSLSLFAFSDAFGYYIAISSVSKSTFTVTLSNPDSYDGCVHYTNTDGTPIYEYNPSGNYATTYTYIKCLGEPIFDDVGTVQLTIIPGATLSFSAVAKVDANLGDNHDTSDRSGDLVMDFFNNNNGTSREYVGHHDRSGEYDIVADQSFEWVKSQNCNGKYLVSGSSSEINIVLP